MTKHNFEPRHKEMGRHVISGLLNSGFIQGVRVLCQFGSVIVLSRLLPATDFGLVAMVSPVYAFIMLFQDLGLGQATIQKSGLTHDEVNAFFWINIALGAACMVIVIAISPLAGWYYHEPRVVPLMAAMGVLILVSSVGNQPGAILLRRMEFGVLALNGAVGSLTGLAVSIVLAIIFKNVWALYFGMVASTLIPVMGVWYASRWRPSMPRRVRGIRAMLKFGTGITSSNIAGLLSGTMDNVLIGWKWGDHALGLYDRAYKLLLFPLQRIVGPVMGTLVPVLSRLAGEPERYRRIFLKTMAQVTLVTWPGIVWSIVLADILVPALLGKQWADSASIFRVLAIAGLLKVVNDAAGCLFVSQARTGNLARWSMFVAVTSISAFVIGLPYGPTGVATGYALCECIWTPLLWWYIGRRGPIGVRPVIRVILPQILSGIVSALFLLLYRKLQMPPLILLAGGLVLSYAAAALTMSLSRSGRETLKNTWDAGQRILAHVGLKKYGHP